MDWVEDVARDSSEGWALVGDLNWRKCYADHLSEDQKLCDMVKSTTLVDMWPSSMVTRRMKAKHLDSIAVPGFPHHCLVTFSVSIPSKPKQHSGDITRLKRTAHFVRNLGTIISESESQDLKYNIDQKLLSSEHATLPHRWKHWHVRAEATFDAAAGDSWRDETCKVERTKG